MEQSEPDRRTHERRKVNYDTLDKKIDRKFDQLTTRLQKFFTKALIAITVIGLTSAAGVIGVILVTREIQQQRYDSLLSTCLKQNDHHDRAIQKSRDVLSPEALPTVIVIVNELQPYVPDCKKQAHTRVRGE